jgi:hypothetical protein
MHILKRCLLPLAVLLLPLREQWTGIKVYKIGDEAEKQAFVVGKTGAGQWAGLKTRVAET